MLKIWNWLVNSSADPTKLSRTVMGFLGTVASVLVLTSPLVHVHIGDQQVTAIIDLTGQIVVAFCAVISAVAGVLALARKIYFTVLSWKSDQQ